MMIMFIYFLDLAGIQPDYVKVLENYERSKNFKLAKLIGTIVQIRTQELEYCDNLLQDVCFDIQFECQVDSFDYSFIMKFLKDRTTVQSGTLLALVYLYGLFGETCSPRKALQILRDRSDQMCESLFEYYSEVYKELAGVVGPEVAELIIFYTHVLKDEPSSANEIQPIEESS